MKLPVNVATGKKVLIGGLTVVAGLVIFNTLRTLAGTGFFGKLLDGQALKR